MGQKMDKFLLLMWKNFLLQWRHPKQTLVEILVPVMFTMLLVVIRSLINPKPHPDQRYTSFTPNMLNVNQIQVLTIPWSPSTNPYLEKIMNATALAINQEHQYNKVLLVPCNSSVELEMFGQNQLNLLGLMAGVQFDDSLAGNRALTVDVTVTIRFPSELRDFGGSRNWKTNSLFPLYQMPGPRDYYVNSGADPNYNAEGFLKLQQELSLSIINHFKPHFKRNTLNIEMQRFDYPAWTEDLLFQALQTFVGVIIMLAFVYTCISTVRAITIEKERQLKETMKIMGLPGWLHWTAWFLKTFALLFITAILMVFLMKIKWYPGTDYTIFTYSDPSVILLFLVFHISATITFCFAISVFFSKANTAATFAGLMWFCSYFPYSLMQSKYETMGLAEKLFASVFSNTAIAYVFQLVLMFEGNEEGLQWNNLWKTVNSEDNLKPGYLMIMLVIDCLIYLLVALYVEAIFPGEYGVSQKWYFPFTSSYWCGNPVEVDVLEEPVVKNEYYEAEPTHLEVGIKIKRLCKSFSNKKIAVNDLSLNVYKDQITALLGHNGAGKTTTMSMLIGMFPPSGGTATVAGYDICRDIAGVRNSLGFCPQHNILFDELTVREHLYFYSKLKGLRKEEIEAEIEKYVELMELSAKAGSLSSMLSGGMKRKLSVAIALCGGSSVVVLDEPTAGMDPAARRFLWDLLQLQKKGRTILFTTHFMDEADLLGDRIAIMAAGKLQCCGSSLFLKKKFGAGYHLIIDKSLECDVNKITELLRKHIPDIQVESNIGSELTYVLNEKQSAVFEEMLRELEERAGQLEILNYGISLTTLEEVFMKVGAGKEDTSEEAEHNGYDNRAFENNLADEDENGKNDRESRVNVGSTVNYLTGKSLWLNQVRAMFMKRRICITRSWVLLMLQNIIPVAFLILTLFMIKNVGPLDELPKLEIKLDSYDSSVTVVTRTSPNNKYAVAYLDDLSERGKAFINWENEDMAEHMLDETKKSPATIRTLYISGASFEGNSITGWFNNDPYHSPPLSLQLVMNAVLKAEASPNHSIQIVHHPLPFSMKTKLQQLEQMNSLGFHIAFNTGFSMAFVSAFYVMFYIRERASRAKHLQHVSGVQVLPFWGSSFICDFITFLFTSILLIVTLAVFQEDGYRTAEELGRYFSVLIFFGFHMLPLMYVVSFFFDIPSTGFTRITFVNIFIGVTAFLIIQILSQPILELQDIGDTLHWIFLIVPHYSLATAIRDMYATYLKSKLCSILPANNKNCTSTEHYYSLEAPGIGRNVIFSCCTGILLIAILLLTEYRVFKKIKCKIFKNKFPIQSQDETAEDADVSKEQFLVNNLSLDEIQKRTVVLRNLTKHYKRLLAVNKLCLEINKHECFGLLGVNGAGKTSTFKMMTGDTSISSGDVWIKGLSVKTNMQDVYKLIGYCPQFDALLNDLTCRETIIMFGLLRGITMADSKAEAVRLSKKFNFYQHLDKKVRELSGGNKRKLSTSVALVGDPMVLFLDEPTTGMDAANKRHLWKALSKVRESGKSIVLTSHSMEECEALCTRLAIMVNGTFKCLGSTQHLKSKFSKGYTLIVKVGRAEQLNAVIQYVQQHFPGVAIREMHQELITFYIADRTQSWSRMFGVMEKGKDLLDIEDYSLGQSSLEQVFLSFTKYNTQ